MGRVMGDAGCGMRDEAPEGIGSGVWGLGSEWVDARRLEASGPVGGGLGWFADFFGLQHKILSRIKPD